MARLLFFFLIGLAIYFAVRGLQRKSALRERAEERRAATGDGEDMVRCARCGVNVPRSEARADAGRLVCADNPRCPPA